MRDDNLPTFEQMRCNAHHLLSDAEDELRSDWRRGAGPTDDQADALTEAREYIAKANAALDRAAL
ncbi:hypothetical protein ACIBP6_28120 [Nonomuraea terrae]|uniref:hypothetical protein n=1 Tax=Nonomuraea terrae TaxID=2530383 RepID=UPI0037A586E0